VSGKRVKRRGGKTKQARKNGRASTNSLKKSQHPIFDALLMEAMLTPRDQMVTTEEVARELGITEEERAAARAIIATWEPDGPEDDEAAAAPDEGAPAKKQARRRN